MAIDESEVPARMRFAPRDPRGYPVPWFVDLKAPLYNGGPDFRCMDPERWKKAVREHRCWVCGGPINDGPRRLHTFVSGPMCGVNRVSSEPPNHHECAVWSARVCPFLSQPKRIRDERDMPGKDMAGEGIKRNPGVVMLWTCEGYKLFHDGRGPGKHRRLSQLFQLPDPVRVEWICRGREATFDEVLDSVVSGLPLLAEQAQLQGQEAMDELARLIADFSRLMPAIPESQPAQSLV